MLGLEIKRNINPIHAFYKTPCGTSDNYKDSIKIKKFTGI